MADMNRFSVIIPAAGAGKRFSAGTADTASSQKLTKIELELAGKPVFLWSVDQFIRREDVAQVIIAANPQTTDAFTARWGKLLASPKIKIIPGGVKERWETVLKALEHVDKKATHIAVHDAARPLITSELIERIFAACQDCHAVLPGVAVADTLKKAAGKPPKVIQTLSRENLYAIQTPQVFEIKLLQRAYASIKNDEADAHRTTAKVTDDAGLVEALGQVVHIVEGDASNFKITRPADLQLARAWLTALQGKN